MCAVAILGGGGLGLGLFKVGARQASAIGKVNDKGAVAKEGIRARLERGKGIRVLGGKGVLGNLAVLAAEVTDLARRGVRGYTGRAVAAVGRVEMTTGRGAVAIGSGVDVNVVGLSRESARASAVGK